MERRKKKTPRKKKATSARARGPAFAESGARVRRSKSKSNVIGYARVSKGDQSNNLQLDALGEVGAVKIFKEKDSGANWARVELHKMLEQLREGDVVYVWKLDRISRSVRDLLHILDKIESAGARLRSCTELFDTSSSAGRMMMQMIGVFAEFDRSMIRERTKAGLAAAKKRGRVPGRKPLLSAEQVEQVREWRDEGRTLAEIARILQVSRQTVMRA